MEVKIKTAKLRRSGGALTLTLPASWHKDFQLRPGSEVDVYRDDQERLVIVPHKEVTQ